MSRWTIEQATDRLARRRMMGMPVPRDSYLWASLRLNVAMSKAGKAAARDLAPALNRLSAAYSASGASLERLAEALRDKRP